MSDSRKIMTQDAEASLSAYIKNSDDLVFYCQYLSFNLKQQLDAVRRGINQAENVSIAAELEGEADEIEYKKHANFLSSKGYTNFDENHSTEETLQFSIEFNSSSIEGQNPPQIKKTTKPIEERAKLFAEKKENQSLPKVDAYYLKAETEFDRLKTENKNIQEQLIQIFFPFKVINNAVVDEEQLNLLVLKLAKKNSLTLLPLQEISDNIKSTIELVIKNRDEILKNLEKIQALIKVKKDAEPNSIAQSSIQQQLPLPAKTPKFSIKEFHENEIIKKIKKEVEDKLQEEKNRLQSKLMNSNSKVKNEQLGKKLTFIGETINEIDTLKRTLEKSFISSDKKETAQLLIKNYANDVHKVIEKSANDVALKNPISKWANRFWKPLLFVAMSITIVGIIPLVYAKIHHQPTFFSLKTHSQQKMQSVHEEMKKIIRQP